MVNGATRLVLDTVFKGEVDKKISLYFGLEQSPKANIGMSHVMCHVSKTMCPFFFTNFLSYLVEVLFSTDMPFLVNQS